MGARVSRARAIVNSKRPALTLEDIIQSGGKGIKPPIIKFSNELKDGEVIVEMHSANDDLRTPSRKVQDSVFKYFSAARVLILGEKTNGKE